MSWTSRRHRGFTIIEMLVVISIVVILIAMLIPALSGVREAARNTLCMTRLRQNAIAMTSYTQGNNQLLPRAYGSDIQEGGSDPGTRFAWHTRLVGLGYLTAPLQAPRTSDYEPDTVSEGASTLMCPNVGRGMRSVWGWPSGDTISYDNDEWYNVTWRERDDTGYDGMPSEFWVDTSYALNASQGDWTGMSNTGGNPFLAQWTTGHRLGIRRSLRNVQRANQLMMMACGTNYKLGAHMAYVNPRHGGPSSQGDGLNFANLVYFDGHAGSFDPRDCFPAWQTWGPSRQRSPVTPLLRIQD